MTITFLQIALFKEYFNRSLTLELLTGILSWLFTPIKDIKMLGEMAFSDHGIICYTHLVLI